MSFLPVVNIAKVKKFTDEPKFGTVVDNKDPKMLGRVKVEILGLFEGDPEGMPWIRRKLDTAFCGLNVEMFDVPEEGSIVEVKWNYDENTPMYSGAPYSLRKMTNAFTGNYPHQGGFKFGNILIRFDKGSNSLLFENGKAQIMMDGLGDVAIAGSGIHLISETDVIVDAPNTIFKGNVAVEKDLSCGNGASGPITPMTLAIASMGIVTSLE